MLIKIIKFIGLVVFIGLVALNIYVLSFGKTFFYKALAYNFAEVDDYQLFENRVIHKSDKPQSWPIAKNYNKRQLSASLQAQLDTLQTFALVVVKNDSLVFESYSDGYGPHSYSNSFSVAKSIVSTLIGIALQEGKIKSLDTPVGDYLEGFQSKGKEKITIKHVLTMSSGLNWDESYSNPFSMTTEAYYGDDLPRLIYSQHVLEEPGRYFNYLSGNTQILAMVLEKATGKRISTYAEEKLWRPLGMENDALWSLDAKEGSEKAYCCLNSNARDFAKIGNLFLHEGDWKGKRILDSAYVKAATTPASLLDKTTQLPIDCYGYQWWILPTNLGTKVFYARGILGQYIIAIPSQKVVIVRLGKKRGPRIGEHPTEVLTLVEEWNN